MTKTKKKTERETSLEPETPKPRKRGRPKKNPESVEKARVLESTDSNRIGVSDDPPAACCVIDTEEKGGEESLGFMSPKDLVWAKAYPYTWWPGWIKKKSRGKFYVSFFQCERSSWFRESEVRSFENDFQTIMSKKVGKILHPDAIDSALSEFGRRSSLELTCSCQEEFNHDLMDVAKLDVDVDKAFQPLDVLDFVNGIAVSPSFDEVESVGVVRASAQVNAFRRHVFIKRDWIYNETMWISQTAADVEPDAKGTCSEDEAKCSLAHEWNFPEEVDEEQASPAGGEDEEVEGEEEEVEEEEEEVEEEEEEVEDPQIAEQTTPAALEEDEEEEEAREEEVGDPQNTEATTSPALEEDEEEEVGDPQNAEQTASAALEEEEEEEEEPREEEGEQKEVEETEEDNGKESVMQVRSGSVIYEGNSKENCVQEQSMERPQITPSEDFHPLEALAFVRRMAVSLCGDNVDTIDAVRAASHVNAFRRHIFIKRDWIYRKTMRLSGSTAGSQANQEKLSSEDEPTREGAQEVKFSDEEENRHKLFVEQAKNGSATCNKTTEEPLLDILSDLQCLALGPFYFVAEGHDLETFDAVRQKVLRYRELVCQNVPNLSSPMRHTSRRNSIAEPNKVKKLPEASSISHVSDLPVNFPNQMKENGVADDDGSEEVELLSALLSKHKKKARVEGKAKEMKACHSKSNDEVVVEPVGKGEVVIPRDSAVFDGEDESNKWHRPKNVKVSDGVSVVVSNDVVDIQKDLADCNGESKGVKRARTKDGSNERHRPKNLKASAGVSNVVSNDVVDSQRNLPERSGESRGIKRDRTKDESSERHGPKNIKVSAGVSNVVSNDVVDIQRNLPGCRGESKGIKRDRTTDVKIRRSTNDLDGKDIVDVQRASPDCNGDSESNKRKKIEGLEVGGTIVERGNAIDIPRDTPDRNAELESNKRQKTDSMKDYSTVGNMEGRHVADHPGYTLDHTSKSGISRRQKVSTTETVPYLAGDGAKTMNGDNSASVKNDDLDSKHSSHVLKDRLHIKPCKEVGAAGDLSNKGVVKRTVFGSNSEGKGRRMEKDKALQPLSMLYISPLSAQSPIKSGRTQVQPSKTHAQPDQPTTLHMKFPKDFQLPSKEELVKQFRTFGPIDYSKTKVFFYTGSAQLVFMQKPDAEAACQYAKRKEIFPAGANVRFWLDQHEHSRRTGYLSTSLPHPTSESSNVNLKSCLRVSNPPGNNVERKHLHVKFPTGGQDLPSVAVETKHVVSTQSDSREKIKEAVPDISAQMLVLLDKCNQAVTKIKDNLGIHSYYSLFTHSYCNTEFDDG